MNLTIDDAAIADLVKQQVSIIIADYKMEFATIDIEKFSEITSLSLSTLLAKFTCEPEIVEVTR